MQNYRCNFKKEGFYIYKSVEEIRKNAIKYSVLKRVQYEADKIYRCDYWRGDPPFYLPHYLKLKFTCRGAYGRRIL